MNLVSTEWLNNNLKNVKIFDASWHMPNSKRNAEKEDGSFLKVDDKVLAERRSNWKKPNLKVNQGILYKYAKYVASASEGCITDK